MTVLTEHLMGCPFRVGVSPQGPDLGRALHLGGSRSKTPGIIGKRDVVWNLEGFGVEWVPGQLKTAQCSAA